MFTREFEMTDPVVRWMESNGLAVKREFVTPWGICDLVGLAFNQTNVARRLRLGQRRPLSSILRAALLLQIPDTESSKSISVSKLARDLQPFVREQTVREEVARLVAGKFVIEANGRLQKLNGWIPLHKKFVSVELKLSRIDEAANQAFRNLGFAAESYVALPAPVVERVKRDHARRAAFEDSGIGLLAVRSHSCEVALPATATARRAEPSVQLYCAEKFWRSHATGS